MRNASRILWMLAAVGLAAPALAKNPNPGVVPPNAKAYGKTLAEWNAEWWKWFLKIDTAVHPALGGDCAEGQSGKVFHIAADFLGGVGVPCTIPAGKAVFVPIVNVECSTVEPAPFFGADEEELTDCATCWGDHIVVDSLTMTLDGVPLEDLGAYRAVSPMFTFEYPADNIFGIAGGPSTGESVGDGYWILLPPLSAGVHTLSYFGTFDFPDGDEGCGGSGGGFSFGFGGDYVLTVE
jgi:hypothetical protein